MDYLLWTMANLICFGAGVWFGWHTTKPVLKRPNSAQIGAQNERNIAQAPSTPPDKNEAHLDPSQGLKTPLSVKPLPPRSKILKAPTPAEVRKARDKQIEADYYKTHPERKKGTFVW